jgi:hypothetical protein
MINQLVWLMGLRAAEFFDPLRHYLEFAKLLKQRSLIRLILRYILALDAPYEKFTGTIGKLPIAIVHLDGMDGVMRRSAG